MLGLASNPEMVRNVAIVGHLHHGKTSLVDMLVYETHKIDFDCDKPVGFTCFRIGQEVKLTREQNDLAPIYGYAFPLPGTTHLAQIDTHVTRPSNY